MSKITFLSSEAQPELNWLWWPLLGLFYLFVYLSWTAHPMFNLLLRFDRFGRHVLSPDQRLGSNWFGAVFALALASVVVWLGFKKEIGFFGAIVFAVLSICVAATFNRTGRPRRILGATTAALAAIAFVGTGLLVAEHQLGLTLTNLFALGFIGFQILANSLATR